MKFGDAVLQNMEYSRSDHQPILMSFNNEERDERIGPTLLRNGQNGGKKPDSARWWRKPGNRLVLQFEPVHWRENLPLSMIFFINGIKQ